MKTVALSLLLAFQLLATTPEAVMMHTPNDSFQQSRMLWGLIDPELSLWFSSVPEEESPDEPVLWDFSWRGFLAALFSQPLAKEAAHALPV